MPTMGAGTPQKHDKAPSGYTTTATKKKTATIKPFNASSSFFRTSDLAPSSPAITPRATGGNAGGITPGSGTGAMTASSVPPQSALPGMSSDGGSQYTGFMKQFSPGAAGDIFQNPQMVLNAMYNQAGQSTASPMYNTLRDFYNADPQSLWFLTQGANGGQGGQNALGQNNYGNWLNSVYSNYMAPGGRAFDFDEMMKNISGLSDQSGMQVADQSPLWQLLSSGGAPEQANTMYGLIGDAARVGLAPSMASAFMDAMRRQSDSYLTQNATTEGGAGNFYDWMQNPMQAGR